VPNETPSDNFLSLLDLDNWESFDDFLESSDERILHDIEAGLERRHELREFLLSDPNFRKSVKTVEPKLQEWAKAELFGGNVCAVDGTLSIVPSTSGGRARIGVVATSYKSDKIERVIYVSYRQLAEPVSGAAEYVKKLKIVNKTSSLMMRAAMAFAERELALKRQEAWKFVHGELVPYELRTGAGRPKIILPRSLGLGMRLIENKRAIGIVEDSDDTDLLNAAETLDRFEYIEARGLDRDLDDFLNGSPDPDNPGERLRGAHFNDADQAKFRTFIKDHASQIKIGIFKVGFKPFVFQAHVDNFDRAAALVMTDASMQALQGFPLLVDYADHICSKHLAGKDFEKQIHFKTARFGIEALGYEIDPRKTRRR
jgi:hypothetical protein